MDLTKEDSFKELMLKYTFAKNRLDMELDILIQEYELKNGYNPVEHTKSRLKKVESIKKKLDKKGYEFTYDNIVRHVHDVVGVRIICSFVSEVYDIVDIIKSSNQFIIKNEKDYIKNPKESGYTSYHLNLLIPVHLAGRTEYIEGEIQIRTVAMDCWASLDHKLRYKLYDGISNGFEKDLLVCANMMLEVDNRMQQMCEVVKNNKKNGD